MALALQGKPQELNPAKRKDKPNMKKTNDEDILRMFCEEGHTKRAIARHFEVSEQYIGKRLKQLEAFSLPESYRKLTLKQKKYALARIEGKSKTDSAMEAYETKDRNSAKALGHNLSKDPDVNLAISELMAQEGLTRRYRVQRLKAMIDCSDLNVCGRGLDIANKLTGEYAPQQIETITGDEIRALLDSIAPIKEVNVIEIETIEEKPD